MKLDFDTFRSRQANLQDLDPINHLIVRSRSFIGYDETNNKNFIAHFGVNVEYLTQQFAFVYENKAEIISVYGMSFVDNPKLDYFFITPSMIGKGLGREMWERVCTFTHDQGWSHFEFIANPYSVPFYLHMGAIIVADYGSVDAGMKVMNMRI